RKQAAGSMPEGAIVVAQYAEDWMLEPDFLERAGGFVTATGGFNDHVAILMKQKRKTLMLAGDQFTTVAAQVGQQATLACARFKGEHGAFIVAGDLCGKLASHASLSSAFSDVPLARAVPSRDDLSPPEGTFRQVASGFQWLTDQNARLLAFFAPGAGLDCLANPIKLSMSPQRSKLLAETRARVERLVQGAEALLDGYQAFLGLAGDSRALEVQSLRIELPELINRLKALKKTIRSRLKAIVRSLDGGEIRQISFHQWLAACHQLRSSLQALNPKEAKQIRSIHELIFALHQRFVNALAPVTLVSRQGRISTEKKITYVDCTTPGGSDEKAPLLRPSWKALIEKFLCSGTVVIMDD
ncbi:PEP-utilizing enzyme, partial [Endozoicomonas sp. ONNA1]|uniref:PEP-utilizing enzyme n=1 Tax=Endozoicomonas sp. ONNA1 TaxID=2828740 RepID=UPI0021498D15